MYVLEISFLVRQRLRWILVGAWYSMQKQRPPRRLGNIYSIQHLLSQLHPHANYTYASVILGFVVMLQDGIVGIMNFLR